MENYFKIIDIIDDIAKSQREATTEEICTIDALAKENNENIEEYISDLANANDCGDCHTWGEVIEAFKELWKNGERIEIKYENTNETDLENLLNDLELLGKLGNGTLLNAIKMLTENN